MITFHPVFKIFQRGSPFAERGCLELSTSSAISCWATTGSGFRLCLLKVECLIPLMFLISFLQNCAISWASSYNNLANFYWGGGLSPCLRFPERLSIHPVLIHSFVGNTVFWQSANSYLKVHLITLAHFNQQGFIGCFLCSDTLLDLTESRLPGLKQPRVMTTVFLMSKWRSKEPATSLQVMRLFRRLLTFPFPVLVRTYALLEKWKRVWNHGGHFSEPCIVFGACFVISPIPLRT